MAEVFHPEDFKGMMPKEPATIRIPKAFILQIDLECEMTDFKHEDDGEGNMDVTFSVIRKKKGPQDG